MSWIRQGVNRGIAMNQYVTKSDDLRRIGNTINPLRLYFAQLIKCLANDFELTLYDERNNRSQA